MADWLRGPRLAVLILAVGSVLGALSKWFLVWLSQRIGGPEAMGAYGYFFAIATPIFVVSQLGLHTILLSSRFAFPWRTLVLLRIVGTSLACLILAIFVVADSRVGFWLGISIILLKVFDSFTDLELSRLQYDNRTDLVAGLMVAGGLLAVAMSSFAAYLTSSLVAAVLAASFASAAVACVSRVLSQRVAYAANQASGGYCGVLKISLPVTAAQLLSSLLIYLPTLILGFGASIAEVGVFVGVSYVLTFANLIGASVSKVLITPLRRLALGGGGSRVVFLRVRSVSFKLLLAGFPLLVVFVFLGSNFFEWLYGPAYALSPSVLVLFGLAGLLTVISHVQSVALTVLNYYYGVVLSFVVACLVTIMSGVLLLYLNGSSLVVGASMAAAGAAARAAMLWGGVARAGASRV